MNFRQDLSRQLGLMCLQLEPETSKPSPDARKLTQVMESWESTNSLSNLVSNLYLVKSTGDEGISLFHLLPTQGRLALVAWPPDLAKIHATFDDPNLVSRAGVSEAALRHHEMSAQH